MRDIYKSGYGNLFPDSNLLSIVVPAIRHFQDTKKTRESKFRILDLGCGKGSNILIVNEFEEVVYTGVDISNQAAEIARLRINSLNLSQRAQIHVLATEQFLTSQHDKWDLILDRASLQHHEVLQDDSGREKFLNMLSSKLAPKGVLVSLWAGKRNHNTDIRFSSFVPFEEIRSAFAEVFNIVSLKQYSKFDLHSDQNQLVGEEFLIVAKSRPHQNV